MQQTLTHWFSARPGGVVTGVGLLIALLAGCSAPPHTTGSGIRADLPEPQATLTDYRQVDCPAIWSFNETAAINNPLYWLRTMECAALLSAADARAQAQRLPAEEWQNRFRQAVLLSNGNVTPPERRQYLDSLEGDSDDYPATVRPLLMLWREGQGSLLQLSGERSRYSHLQQSSDAQLDELRQQLAATSEALTVTRRKLDSLTDIERQLSSRRSPDAADATHTGDKNEASTGDDAPAGHTEEAVSHDQK